MNTISRALLLALAVSPSLAMAAPFTAAVQNDVYSGIVNGIPTPNDNNDQAPDLHDAVNAVLGTSYTRNSELDDRFVSPDELFVSNYDGAHSVTLIGLAAANSNVLGVYTDPGIGLAKTAITNPFSGYYVTGDGLSAASAFAAAEFNVTGSFGFYLDSKQWDSGITKTFYSEAALNAPHGGYDHMVSYALSELNGQTFWLDQGDGAYKYTFENALLIGWEDLGLKDGKLGDEDYDDIMYLIDFRTKPNPHVNAPGALLLLGGALAGLATMRRRRV